MSNRKRHYDWQRDLWKRRLIGTTHAPGPPLSEAMRKCLDAQADNGAFDWAGLPEDNLRCWGWTVDTCIRVAKELLDQECPMPSCSLSTLCVLAKIDEGYGRERHLFKVELEKAVNYLMHSLGRDQALVLSTVAAIRKQLASEPCRISLEGVNYEKRGRAWINVVAGIKAPVYLAERLDRKCRRNYPQGFRKADLDTYIRKNTTDTQASKKKPVAKKKKKA